MRINHNIASLNTYRQLSANSANGSKSLEKLSSGLRINKAGDDAAGLAISEKMRGQIRGLDQAARNAQDGISLVQTAEGALNETHSILQRMRELAVQASNDTNVGADRSEIQKEMNQLTSEINRIGNTTEFNTRKLLNGNASGASATGSAGVDTLTITAIAVGETITIDGEVFTAKAASGADYSANQFEEGTDDTTQAENLARAIQNNTALSSKYDVTTNAGVITFTQKEGSYSATALVASTDSAAGNAVAANTAPGVAGKDGKLTMQVGANGGQTFTVDISDMRADATGVEVATLATSGVTTKNASTGKTAHYTASGVASDGTSDTNSYKALDITTADYASAAIDVIDDAIKTVSGERSKLGAYANRLEHTVNNLGTSSENLTAAESRIRDVDMAKEMMEFTKNNILSQAAQAMLAQANQQPQGVLQLLR